MSLPKKEARGRSRWSHSTRPCPDRVHGLLRSRSSSHTTDAVWNRYPTGDVPKLEGKVDGGLSIHRKECAVFSKVLIVPRVTWKAFSMFATVPVSLRSRSSEFR